MRASGLARSGRGPRGLSLAEVTDLVASAEPRRVMLEHPFPPRNQRAVPACVACSIVTAMEALDARRGTAMRLSPLFSYFTSRPLAQTLTDVQLPTALARGQSDGVCRLKLHRPPFTADGAKTPPTTAAVEDARNHRLVLLDRTRPSTNPFRYFKLRDPRDPQSWRSVLMRGFPLIVGFHMGDGYESITPQRPFPSSAGAGGPLHAATVLGYDDNALGRGALRIKDSRGAAFGDGGSWWLPYDILSTMTIDQGWALTEISYDT